MHTSAITYTQKERTGKIVIGFTDVMRVLLAPCVTDAEMNLMLGQVLSPLFFPIANVMSRLCVCVAHGGHGHIAGAQAFVCACISAFPSFSDECLGHSCGASRTPLRVSRPCTHARTRVVCLGGRAGRAATH